MRDLGKILWFVLTDYRKRKSYRPARVSFEGSHPRFGHLRFRTPSRIKIRCGRLVSLLYSRRLSKRRTGCNSLKAALSVRFFRNFVRHAVRGGLGCGRNGEARCRLLAELRLDEVDALFSHQASFAPRDGPSRNPSSSRSSPSSRSAILRLTAAVTNLGCSLRSIRFPRLM